MTKSTRKYLILGLAFGAGLIAVFLLIFSLRGGAARSEIDSLTIEKNGNKLTVGKDGSVTYRTGEGVFEDFWGRDKTDAFFSYFDKNYEGGSDLVTGGANSVTINRGGVTYQYLLGDDEIINAAEDDAQDPDGGGDGGGGDDINQFFGSPTPKPSGSPTSPPGPPPPGGPDPECLFWKLSYCVIPRPPSPSPTSTASPLADPNANVIDVQDCGQWLENGQIIPTIISNTLCLPTPTP